MKIRPVGAELFHARTDRRTDMTKVIITLRNFANAAKHTCLRKYDSCRIVNSLSVSRGGK